MVPDKLTLVVIPKNPETDYGLFVRPFTNYSWLAIGGIIVLSVVCLGTPFLYSSDVESTSGHQAKKKYNLCLTDSVILLIFLMF